MAGKALDFMIRHMVLMENLRGILGFEDRPLIVTLEAGKFGYMTVPGNHLGVTLLTLDAPVNVNLMVEGKGLADLDIPRASKWQVLQPVTNSFWSLVL